MLRSAAAPVRVVMLLALMATEVLPSRMLRADAATDVTSEYNTVRKQHKNLEDKVKQIHKYTTDCLDVLTI